MLDNQLDAFGVPIPEHKVELEVTIDRQMLHDIMVTAFDGDYGGSLYWAAVTKLESSGPNEDDCIWDAITLRKVANRIKSETYRVDHTVLVKGIQALADQGWKSVIDAVLEGDAGMIDAPLADSIVQEGLFGKQVYC